jgi:hypothetical protein
MVAKTPRVTHTIKPPSPRVFVLGNRREGTSEVIAALRSLATPDKLESWPARVFAPPPREDGVVMLINDFGPSGQSARVLQLETPKRTFSLYECVDQPQALMIGASNRCDAALWVRSAEVDCDLDPASAMLEAARYLGAERALVFVIDAERVAQPRRDRVEREARELLSLAGFAADECPVVCSTGVIEQESHQWRAGASALRDLLEEHVPYVDEDPYVALVVDDVFAIKNRGTVVTGQITAGKLAVGDRLELVRPTGRRPITILGIEMFRRLLETARRPDYVGLLIDVARDEVARGDLIVSPGEGVVARRANVRGYCWRPPEVWPPTERLRCVGSLSDQRVRVSMTTPSPLVLGPFEAQIEFDAPTMQFPGRSLLWRQGEDAIFASVLFESSLD